MIAKRHFPTQKNSQAPSKQRGAALLIALVIMTIAMGIAANIMFRQQLHTRLASNISNLEQAYPFATALEDWSRTILIRDFEDSPESDDLTEAWATEIPPIPIPGRVMTGRLYDLQAKLNLNNLFPPERPVEVEPRELPEDASDEEKREEARLIKDQNRYIFAKQRTTRLLETVDTEESIGPALNFSDTVQDWIDPDTETSPGGAESVYYQSQDPAYNTANSYLVNDTELRLLKDIDTDAYKLIRPFFAALPEYTPVNVNTAPIEVLQALGFTPEASENLVVNREENPFKSMQDFLDIGVVSTATAGEEPEVYKQDISVKSDYFFLQGEVNIGTARLYINSILHRKDGKVTVVSRDFSNQQIVKDQEPEE